MYSPSFQDTELKLHRCVNDSQLQVAERLTILPYPRGVENKGLITQKKRKFDVHSHSFRDIELKFHRYVNDSQLQVAGRLTILPYPRRGR